MKCTWKLAAAGLVSLAALVVGCDGSDDGSDPAPDAGPGPAITADQLVARAAQATCDALFRCCLSNEDLAAYFLPVSTRDREGDDVDLIDRVPPNAPLTAEQCPDLLSDIFTRSGIGPWAVAAADGQVAFDEDAAIACLDNLDDASCGEPARAALFDPTCFGLSAPGGGSEQRSFIARTTTSGACSSIVDGFGGLYYGTCDPNAAFCCVLDNTGRCGFPREGAIGNCAPVSAVGEECSFFDPTQLCATGVDCIVDGQRDVCAAPLTAPIELGQPCYDPATFQVLGECVDGVCDVLGASPVCIPFIEDGDACDSSDECRSRVCEENRCVADTTCEGP